MPSLTSSLVLASGLFTVAVAQVPLASKHFTWSDLPYQADTDTGERGVQYGYNLCNSTTEGVNSLCQTAIINSIDDFCLWGPPLPNSVVGNTEGESIAWCTKPGYGTRVIPKGALKAVQFMKTPDYIQVTGLIDQTFINLQADDSGGELDPHGADQRGNPLGALLFSKAWSGDFIQAIEWHNFMGGNAFCLKACDPSGAHAADYCQHIFDRIGCAYNAPAAYADGVFESCLGDNQDFPGIYTDAAGVVQTYTQPPESLGAISTMPYDPRIPASSSCTPYESASLYADAPVATGHTAAASTTGSHNSNSGSNSGSGNRSGSGSTRTSSGGNVNAQSTGTTSSTGAASSSAVVSLTALVGAAFVAVLAL